MPLLNGLRHRRDMANVTDGRQAYNTDRGLEPEGLRHTLCDQISGRVIRTPRGYPN